MAPFPSSPILGNVALPLRHIRCQLSSADLPLLDEPCVWLESSWGVEHEGQTGLGGRKELRGLVQRPPSSSRGVSGE